MHARIYLLALLAVWVNNYKMPAAGVYMSNRMCFSQTDTNRIGLHNFSDYAPGNFPKGWTTTGKAEVAEINGMQGRWLWITKPGILVPGFLDQYPDVFTFEFDLMHGVPISGGGITVGFAELGPGEKPQDFWNGRNRVTFEFNTANTGSKTGYTRSHSRKNLKNELVKQVYTELLSDLYNPVRISIQRNKERIQVFINGQRIWDLPQALSSDARINLIAFHASYAEERVKQYLGNVSLSEGVPVAIRQYDSIGKPIKDIEVRTGSDKKLPEKAVSPNLNPKGNDVDIGGINLSGDSLVPSPITKNPGPKQILDSIKTTNPLNSQKIRLCIDKTITGALPVRPERVTPTILPRIKQDGTLDGAKGAIQQGLTGLTDKMWDPGDRISVAFIPGQASERIIERVRQIAQTWERIANIHFWFVPDTSGAMVRVGFDTTDGSWSWLGRDILLNNGGKKTMNFGWLRDTLEERYFRSVVLHEFGHALGFIHEHQAPAAGIQWNKEKVYNYFGSSPRLWTMNQVDENIFKKYDQSQTNSSVYDSRSIMHYYFPTELTKDGFSFSENTQLSGIDSEFVRQVYPPPFEPADPSGTLRTGDDCDEIFFQVDYRAEGLADYEVEFVLENGSDDNGRQVTWWKRIGLPLKGGGESGLEVQDRLVARRKMNISMLDQTRAVSFWKAKLFGVHTLLNYKWPVLPAIIGGCRISLVWKRDTCL